VRALAVTLFSLLLASGFGSYLSRSLSARVASGSLPPWTAVAPFLGVVLLGAGYAFALPALFAAWMGLALPWRVALAALLLAPLGLLMGMPLPLRLVALRERRPELVLWAWGLNGTCSVIGATACVMVARVAGYRSALLVGVACYGVALACARPARGSVQEGTLGA
jgi:hypothetical protein